MGRKALRWLNDMVLCEKAKVTRTTPTRPLYIYICMRRGVPKGTFRTHFA